MTGIKKIDNSGIIILIAFITLLPFLVLCFYNHPATDDYGCANIAKQYGFWGAQAYWYNNWKCALVHTMIMSINPLTINWFSGFKIIPFILFFVLIFLLNRLISILAENVLKPYQQWAIVSAFLVSYLYSMPNVAHAFYWMTGYASYLVSTMFVLILLSLLLKMKTETPHKTNYILSSIILIILIMQGSESYMVFIFVCISTLLTFSTISIKRLDKTYLLLFLVATAGAIFVLTSPGIYNRAASENPAIHESTRHLSIGIKFVLLEILSYLYGKTILLISFSIVLLPVLDLLFSRLKEKIQNASLLINPLVSFLITFFFSSVFLFPICYISQSHPVGRVSNIAYFYFLLGTFYTLICIWGYLKGKYRISLEGKTCKRVQWIFLCVSLMLFTLPNNIRAAYADLYLGRAAAYNHELNERYKMIATCTSDTCVVSRLHYATSLGFMDITAKTSAWENQAYSTYFGLKAIRLGCEERYK